MQDCRVAQKRDALLAMTSSFAPSRLRVNPIFFFSHAKARRRKGAKEKGRLRAGEQYRGMRGGCAAAAAAQYASGGDSGGNGMSAIVGLLTYLFAFFLLPGWIFLFHEKVGWRFKDTERSERDWWMAGGATSVCLNAWLIWEYLLPDWWRNATIELTG